MATQHNFRVKNGLEVGGVLIVNSSGALQVSPSTVTDNIKLNDSIQLRFGTDNDSNIRHDGNNTKFTHTGNGGLYIGADIFGIQNGAHNENFIMAAANGAVTVYWDGYLRLSTTSTGIKVEGPSGEATMSAQNTTGFHIYTDRDRFYFNKQISLIDNTLTSYDDDLVLKRVGSTKLTLLSTGVSVGGDLTVSGNLNITGDINSTSVTDLDVTDKTITVGVGQNEANSGNSGLLVAGPSTQPSLLWNEGANRWAFNYGVNVAGHVIASNNVYAAGAEGFVFGSSISEGEYIKRSSNDLQFYSGGGHKFTIGTNTTLVSGNLLVPNNSTIQFGDANHTIQGGTNTGGGDMMITSSDDLWLRSRWIRFQDIAGSAGEYARIAHNGSWIYSTLTSRHIKPQGDSSYNLGEVNNRYATVFGDTGRFAYLDIDNNVDIDGTLETDGLTVNNNPVYIRDREGASVAGAGYYRVAENTVGGAGRGAFICTIYTTGGSYAPREVVIQGHTDWSSTETIHTVKSSAANTYFTKARIVRESGDAFLEVYFYGAISDLEIEVVAVGHAGWVAKTGTLTAATGTETRVGPEVLIAPGLNTQDVVNATQGFQVNNQTIVDNSRNIENITSITTEGTAAGGAIVDMRPSDTNQMFRVRFPDSSTMEMGTTRAGSGNIQKAVVYGQAGVDISTNGVLRASMTQLGDFSLDSDCGGLYFGGSTRSTATNAQEYIKKNGLNLDIKGNDNVRLLGDGGNIILWADYTGKVGIGTGTSAPTAKLDVKGDGSDIFLQSNDFKIARIQPRGTGANLDRGLFSLFDQSTEAVRIDSDGPSWFNGANVGIGTDAAEAPLEIYKAIDGDSVGLLVMNQKSYGSGSGTNERSTIALGIAESGQSSVSRKFGTIHVRPYSESDSSHGIFSFGVRGSGAIRDDVLVLRGHSATDQRVGIGISNPQVKVHVDESAGATMLLTRTGANTNGNLGTIRYGNTNWDSNLAEIVGIQDGANDSARIEFKTQPTGGATTTRMIINSTGHLHYNHSNNAGWNSLGTFVIKQLADNKGIGIVDDASQNTLQLRNNGSYSEFYYNVNNPIVFSQGSGERFRFDGDGNILFQGGSPEFHFGTSSSSHYNWRIAAQEVVDKGFEIASGTQSAGSGAASDSYNTRFVIQGDTGNVGIGTNSPNDGKLQVIANATGDWAGYLYNQNSSGPGVHVESNATSTTEVLRVSSRANGGSNYVTFKVLGNGRVGINKGTDGLGADGLHIGTINSNCELDMEHSSGKRYRFMNSSNGSFYFQNKTDNMTVYTVNGSTNETDFTSPVTTAGYKLTANTNLYGTDATISLHSSSNGVYVNGAGTNGWLRLNAAGAENSRNSIDLYGQNGGDYVKIKAGNTDTVYVGANGAGKVGIRTSNPDATLHVDGAVILAGNENKDTTPIAGVHIVDDSYSQWHPTLGPRQVALRVESYWKGNNAHDRAIGDYGGGIVFNILGGHSATHSQNMHGWIGPRVWDTPGRERAALVFATNNDTGTLPSNSSTTITERMCITPAGLVGIKNTNPAATLEVGTLTSGSTGNVIINSEGGNPPALQVKSRTNRARINIQDNDTSGYIIAEDSRISIGFADALSGNNINIKNDHNVGIGTINPQGKLDVDGDLRITRNIESNNIYQFLSMGSDRGANDYGGLYKDYWRMNIMTPGPNTTGESSHHAYGTLIFSGVTGSNTTYADRMCITRNGEVGIGTTTPTYLLDVAGDMGVNEYIYHNDDTNTYFRFQSDRIDIRAGGSDTITVKPTQLDINQSAKYSGFSTSGGANRDQAIYIGRDQTDTSGEWFTMGWKSTARSGEQMQPTNGPYNGGTAFYIEAGGNTEAAGLCLDQDSVNIYGSSDSGATLRVIDKDSDVVTFEMLQTSWDGRFKGNVIAYGSMSSISDRRIKENIEPINPVIDKIKNIGVYKYNKITAPEIYKDRKEIGVIAQEVQKEFPDLVNEETVDPKETAGLDTILSVDYEHLTAVLLKGMQEQQNQIDSMKKQIEELTSKLTGE